MPDKQCPCNGFDHTEAEHIAWLEKVMSEPMTDEDWALAALPVGERTDDAK